ncbi:unnamed protein product [Spirodela intermedia]|uniref:Uncharacterized protein n=1 Tax=Spirodela intermedia TaxID=51605 RepID=A0A7I8L5F4_SPIIN|nr:unnamed protein product [Spirodela intermedia]
MEVGCILKSFILKYVQQDEDLRR